MSTVKHTITINAPIQKVWDTVMDPNRFSDWVTIHRSVKNLSADLQRNGATMDQTMHMRGISFTVHWRLTDVDAPHRAEWNGRGPAGSTAQITYALSELSDDATKFEYMNDFNTPGGRLGNIATKMIVGDASDREARKSLEKLKSLLENS
ncbi:MAG TPA: SRPBCC family protein [Solirubrobacteraceae bacterium]|nr:SRPBCC family protein [Solirubrobacteraceae bacterium]